MKKDKENQAPVKYIELTETKGNKKALFELSTIIRVADTGKHRILVVRESRFKGGVDVIYRVNESLDEINTLLGREVKNNEQ